MDILAATTAALPGQKLSRSKAQPITRGGSDRSYHRIALADGSSVIVMQYTDERPDNAKFGAASATLKRLRIPCPKILAEDEKKRMIWLEDLGEDHLWDHRDDPWKTRKKLYRSTIDAIAKLHAKGADDLKPEELEALEPPFDEKLYRWEHAYFFEHFLSRYSRRAPSYVNSLAKEEEFTAVIQSLSELPRFLVHRDCQSQNVLLRSGKPAFIDYQGLRLGRPEYDIASLLYDPYVEFEDDEREDLLKYAFGDRKPKEWRPIFLRCAAQRLMQALGAYSKLGNEKGTEDFLNYITPALDNLREVLAADAILPRLAPYLSPEALSV